MKELELTKRVFNLDKLEHFMNWGAFGFPWIHIDHVVHMVDWDKHEHPLSRFHSQVSFRDYYINIKGRP